LFWLLCATFIKPDSITYFPVIIKFELFITFDPAFYKTSVVRPVAAFFIPFPAFFILESPAVANEINKLIAFCLA
jgi:hypothetical protein